MSHFTFANTRITELTRAKRQPRGFTLIELLTVITIIGMLMALLLPAVQMVRTTMMNTTCKKHLNQIGLAVKNFKAQHDRFPGGGWGYNWTGDPDRGNGAKQPGGWLYSILPQFDMDDIHDEGLSQPDKNKNTLNATHNTQPLEFLYCPVRRPSQNYPIKNNPLNCDPLTTAARTDYAINAGDQAICQFDGGPSSLANGDDKNWWKTNASKYDTSKFTGLSYLRSEVRRVDDGDQYTYLAGEKFMDPVNYLSGTDPGDLHALFSGYGKDSYRTASAAPQMDKNVDSTFTADCIFGSPHTGGFNVVMCDGSTRTISFGIAIDVHKRLANRSDGNNPNDLDF